MSAASKSADTLDGETLTLEAEASDGKDQVDVVTAVLRSADIPLRATSLIASKVIGCQVSAWWHRDECKDTLGLKRCWKTLFQPSTFENSSTLNQRA